MSNVVDLLTSLLEQVTPSKNHTSDQWLNLVSELKNNLKESRDSITNAKDPLTESLSTILSALQSSGSSGCSSSILSQNKVESSETREECTAKSDTSHKSEAELSESAVKESEQLSDPQLHTTKKRKYSLTTAFRSFFAKGKQGESKDRDNSSEVTSANEGVYQKITPLEKAVKRLRTSTLSSYTKELYPLVSRLSNRGDRNALRLNRDDNFRDDLSGRVPPLNFKLLMPHEHVTSPESSPTSPKNLFKNAETEIVADTDLDSANISAISSKYDVNVVEDDEVDDNSVSSEGTNSNDDTIEVDYSVTNTEDAMVLYEGNREVDEGSTESSGGFVSREGLVVGAYDEGASVADGKDEVDGDQEKDVTDDRGEEVVEGVEAVDGVEVVGGRGGQVNSEGNANTTAVVESVATNLPDADVKDESKVEAAPAFVMSSAPSLDSEKKNEFKEGPREFINKMRESKEHVYTPLREINSTTDKVNLYLVATEMIKSKFFIFKRKMCVFNYNAVDPSVYFNQSYVNPDVDYSIQILAPIDGMHHHINFGDILRLKRVDAHVKHEKGKKYVNILIPDKCNPTVRAWRLNNLDDANNNLDDANSSSSDTLNSSGSSTAPYTGNTNSLAVTGSAAVTENSVYNDAENSGKSINSGKSNSNVSNHGTTGTGSGSTSGSSVTLVGLKSAGEATDNVEIADGNDSASVGAESHATSDDTVIVEERLVIDGAIVPDIRKNDITKSGCEAVDLINSINTSENYNTSTSSSVRDNTNTSSSVRDDSDNVGAIEVNVDGTDGATTAIKATAVADTSDSGATAVNTGNSTAVGTSNDNDVATTANDVEAENFEVWKRNSITVIGSDNLTYTKKDYNILMHLKEYSKRLDPVKVFRRPDLLRTLSQASPENLDFIVKVHNVSKDYTFVVSDATAKALVVELDPMLVENVFRSYNPVKKGDWIKLRSFYKAEGCTSLTLRPSSFACVTRLPPLSQKVVGDETPRPAEKNVNKANGSKANGLPGSKKENGRNRTVNLEVWTRTSCLNNSFPKRIKKSPSFIEKLLSTHHTVTFQKASPEPVTVEKEEGEISQ
ncbi:hypothetical protein MACJ_000434 [Theileria orientalis]|uniref:Uncharacterized protein n=1 Tax=Theileria orientalis TaxID=68886 RepID=A0A976M428_THEOR|nr:hypothetical protein MACJ_000434 [Theileria orientalis]